MTLPREFGFQGMFERALAGSVGNYVVFPGLIENRFVVTATPGPSFDQVKRAPINGIQIVARGE
jgi:alpha-D-ribose 1-methylphosphonate 5-phosphate C-P lyase